MSRKFKPIDYYERPYVYYLLPFRFIRLSLEKELVVNEFGDYLILSTGSVNRIVSHTLDPKTDESLYADLTANFFISQEQLPELMPVMATRYRTKKSFLDNFTSLHIFVISLRCEHTCHYCQVSRVSEDKDMFDMQRSHIDQGIQLMMRSPNPHVTMEFQGGEALLAFDNIKYAVLKAASEAKKKAKQISYVICSNLAPINEEMLAFCQIHNILISTSLDGPAFIHNANRHRPGNNSYELAIKGIKQSRQVLGNDRVAALLTTTNLSLQYPDEIVDEYFNQGFRSIFLRPISPYGFARKNDHKNKYLTENFLVFYKKALGRIIDFNKRGEFFREEYAAIILKKILTPFPVGYVDLQSPAGMIDSVIVFNYNGKVYASDEARMLAEMQDETFLLGSLDTHSYEDIFYGEKSKSFQPYLTNESLPGCSECALQPYCGADPVYNHATQGSLTGHRPTSSFCERNMGIILYLFELMDGDKEIEKIFHSWVSENGS